jgi:hypothetical protein
MFGHVPIHFAGVARSNLRAPSQIAHRVFTTFLLFQSDAPHSRLQIFALGRPCFISWMEQMSKSCWRPDVRCQPGPRAATGICVVPRKLHVIERRITELLCLIFLRLK